MELPRSLLMCRLEILTKQRDSFMEFAYSSRERLSVGKTIKRYLISVQRPREGFVRREKLLSDIAGANSTYAGLVPTFYTVGIQVSRVDNSGDGLPLIISQIVRKQCFDFV